MFCLLWLLISYRHLCLRIIVFVFLFSDCCVQLPSEFQTVSSDNRLHGCWCDWVVDFAFCLFCVCLIWDLLVSVMDAQVHYVVCFVSILVVRMCFRCCWYALSASICVSMVAFWAHAFMQQSIEPHMNCNFNYSTHSVYLPLCLASRRQNACTFIYTCNHITIWHSCNWTEHVLRSEWNCHTHALDVFLMPCPALLGTCSNLLAASCSVWNTDWNSECIDPG